MEFFRIRRDIPFMRFALTFNVISLVTFVLAVLFLAARGLNLGVDFRTGGIYRPGIGWTNTPTAGAPSARSGHTAVWTGAEMVIWGGVNATGETNTGLRFNPALNSDANRGDECRVRTLAPHGGVDRPVHDRLRRTEGGRSRLWDHSVRSACGQMVLRSQWRSALRPCCGLDRNPDARR